MPVLAARRGRHVASPLSLTSVSRDSVGTAGGATVRLTGANFTAGTSVLFGADAASSVTFINATTLDAVVPAHAAGDVDVTVRKSGTADAVLEDAVTYWTSPTTIRASSDFDSGALTPFAYLSGANSACVISAARAHTGTKSAYQTATASGVNSQVGITLEQSDIVDGNGRYHRFYIYVPAATLAATKDVGQIKFFLSRTGVSKGFVMLGEGKEFNSSDNSFASRIDQGVAIIATTPPMTADEWHEIQVYERRDTGTSLGTCRIWYDGKLQGEAISADLGDNNPALIRGAAFGLVYTQGAAAYPIEVYLDDIVIADGYIDPPA